MSGIGIILNPRSGKNLGDPKAAARLARRLGDRGVVRTARDRDELARIAEDFRRLQIDVLGISGGDGTNDVTITGFLSVYDDEPLPPIAFLRGGTMNTVANAIGVPRGKPDGLLSSLIKRYADRDRTPLASVERHLLRVGDRYGFNFGTGAIYGFIREYNRTDHKNAVWAAKVLARATGSVIVRGETMRRIAPGWRGQVSVDDGEPLPLRDYFAIGASTVDQIGLGFRPFYRYAERPGAFHLLGIHTTPAGFVRCLPRIWRALPMGSEHTYERVTRGAVLEAAGGVVEYNQDGDLCTHRGPLRVAIGPRVTLLVAHKSGLRGFTP